MFENILNVIQDTYKTKGFIPLHDPKLTGNKKKYLNECIDSTFVSSVGKFVVDSEDKISSLAGTKYAIAISNGTPPLLIPLILANVESEEEATTKPLAFVAAFNAFSYCGAKPVFVDVNKDTVGLSSSALKEFLEKNTLIKNQRCVDKEMGKIIKACVPIHTFGHPYKIDKIKDICDQYYIVVIEDAAESLGSLYKGGHTGTFGQMGMISFNGNKIITAGGGESILTNDEVLVKRPNYITTAAKESHKWVFNHDMIGYIYRMPNLNAALIVAQLEQLDSFVLNKREVKKAYEDFFFDTDIKFIKEPKDSRSNYWLNAIILKDNKQRDLFLYETNSAGVMISPIWALMNKLTMFKNAQWDDLNNAEWPEQRVMNIPSSVIAS